MKNKNVNLHRSRPILKNSHLDITHTWEIILFTQPKIKNINIYILNISEKQLEYSSWIQKLHCKKIFHFRDCLKSNWKQKQNRTTKQAKYKFTQMEKTRIIQTKNQTNPNGVYSYRMILWELFHKKDIFF